MESKQDINDFEQALRTDLHQYLLSLDKVDERLPEAPDIEGLWPKIGESYLPDGMREFADYPTVSLGWMMFLGMAIAKYWDTDWELYSKVADLYHYLRDQRDYDHLDDHICEKVLLLTEEERQAMVNVVAECAARTYHHALPRQSPAWHARSLPGLCGGAPPALPHGHGDGTETAGLPHDEVGLKTAPRGIRYCAEGLRTVPKGIFVCGSKPVTIQQ